MEYTPATAGGGIPGHTEGTVFVEEKNIVVELELKVVRVYGTDVDIELEDILVDVLVVYVGVVKLGVGELEVKIDVGDDDELEYSCVNEIVDLVVEDDTEVASEDKLVGVIELVTSDGQVEDDGEIVTSDDRVVVEDEEVALDDHVVVEGEEVALDIQVVVDSMVVSGVDLGLSLVGPVSVVMVEEKLVDTTDVVFNGQVVREVKLLMDEGVEPMLVEESE